VKGQTELFNLADDPSEQRNIVDNHSEVVTTLGHAFDVWIEQMADPITGGNRRWKLEPANENPSDREKMRMKKSKERQKRREAEKKGTTKSTITTEPTE
jgi:hypothetical protein